MNHNNRLTGSMLASALFLSGIAHAQNYDLVISNGRIVAITQDKITGTETIDATGLVVAPGFIDTYYHATDPFGQKLGLADGITTAMDIEHGILHAGE